jgi:Ca-activated chloride channel family protein
MRRFPFALLLLLLSFAPVSASDPFVMQAETQASAPDGANDVFTLNVAVRLVEIPVLVRTAGGELAADNLQQSNFEVFEDNVAQDILLFKHEDTPLRIGIVLNTANIAGRRDRIDGAASSFIRASNPSSKTFSLNFDGASYYKQPQFHRGIADLADAFVETPDVAKQNAGTGVRKAALLIADVDGNDSRLLNNGLSSLLRFLQESNDILIYAVGLQAENGKPASKAVRENFIQIAERTGGEAYFPKSVDELPEICKQIARDLRNQYTLGYSPKNKNNDGSWRSIRVSVISPPLGPKPIVRARQGYVAPTQ